MTNSTSPVALTEMANAIRFLSADAVQKANSGHPGMPMGMADVATVLFTQFLKFDISDPKWPDRDRFILSAGHGSMLLYSLMDLTGSKDMTIEQIKNFRQLGSITAGHPEYGHAAGVETTTGPLGQGLANAVGMALSERMLAARFGGDVVDHFTYVIAGDGCLMEGISHEAISLAGHLKLSKLIVLFDDNKISIDGPTDLTVSDDQCARFAASGWDTVAMDGHDPDAVAAAIAQARTTDRPSLIACRIRSRARRRSPRMASASTPRATARSRRSSRTSSLVRPAPGAKIPARKTSASPSCARTSGSSTAPARPIWPIFSVSGIASRAATPPR